MTATGFDPIVWGVIRTCRARIKPSLANPQGDCVYEGNKTDRFVVTYSGLSPAPSTRMTASPSGRFGASTSRTIRLLFFDLRR